MKKLMSAAAMALAATSAAAQERDEGMVPVYVQPPAPDAPKVDHMSHWCFMNGGMLMKGARGDWVFCVDQRALISLPGEYPTMEQED